MTAPCCPCSVERHAYNGCANCACAVTWPEHPDRDNDRTPEAHPARIAELQRLRERIEKAGERLTFMLHIYGGYTIGSRGPAGCIMDALDEVAPDAAALVREHGPDEAYRRLYDAETGQRRPAPRTFVRLVDDPNAGLDYETCLNCQKHIRHHYGAPNEATPQWPAYRCDPKPEAALADSDE